MIFQYPNRYCEKLLWMIKITMIIIIIIIIMIIIIISIITVRVL